MDVPSERTEAVKRWGSTISERWNTHTNTHTGQLVPRTLLRKRYVILKVIGRGGMGAVYQAKDAKRQGTLCAIKEMSLSMVAPEEQAQAIKNFKIEAKMLSVLSHPYLPAFTHFFAENQRYFLVMEYIDGATLEELLERNVGRNHNPFSEQRVLSWAEQLCDVLEYLHSQNPPIIFRDMKPGNVMLTRQGHIKLIDFGIARFFRPTNETDTQLLGTPGYAPPEQYGTTQTDERSDIYALGMSLHHLLTNKFSDNGFGVKARDIRATNPQISVSVARALEKATALEPADRYESVAAFRNALLGGRAFVFETGEAASEPRMLANLCANYPEEAFEYLESGEIANWLHEIGEDGLSALARRIRTAQLDPMQAVEQFVDAVLRASSQSSASPAYYGSNGHSQHGRQWSERDARDDSYQDYAAGQASLSSRAHMHALGYGTAIAVKPKTLDFGPVYPPGVSAPLKISIDGAQNRWVKGTIRASEPWIRLDRSEFDGPNAYVNVQIRSAQLNSYTPYKGEVIIYPEGGTPITVVVGADIQGYTSQARRPGKTISPDDDDEEEEGTVSAQEQNSNEPIAIVDQKALTKYGSPNETVDGWDASMMTTRAQAYSRYGLTFTTACMASALWYTFLTQILRPPMEPSSPWFVLFLAGMVVAATVGAILVTRPHAWFGREMQNRLITGTCGALLVLAPASALLQIATNAMGSAIQPMDLLPLLALTALGATYSTEPAVSKNFWSRILAASMRSMYIRWAIVLTATVGGGAFGYLLTMGFTPWGFTLLGVLVGTAIAFAFIMRLYHLLKLYRRR